MSRQALFHKIDFFAKDANRRFSRHEKPKYYYTKFVGEKLKEGK